MRMKLTSWLIIWCLITQMSVPAIMARPAPLPNNTGSNIPMTLFNQSMPETDRQLLQNYLVFLYDVTTIRRQMRPLNQQLNQALLAEQEWGKLQITDTNFSALREEAENAATFLRDQSIPIEKRLFPALDELEEQFLAMMQEGRTSGKVPNALMETARQLETMRNSEDEFYALKMNYLARLTGLRANILDNYLLRGKGKNTQIDLKSLQNNQMAIVKIATKMETLERDSEKAKTAFKEQEKNYNRQIIDQLQLQAESYNTLITAIQRHIVLLRAEGGQNPHHHADLLAETELVLDQRLATVKEKLITLDTGRPAENFLYLPDEWGNSPQTRDLTLEFQRIGAELINRTRNRVVQATELLTVLDGLHGQLGNLTGSFKEISNTAVLPDQETREAIHQSTSKIFTETEKSINELRTQLKETLELLPPTNLSPASIMENRDYSGNIIQANQQLEELTPRVSAIERDVWAVNVELAQALEKLFGDQAEKAQDWIALEKEAQKLDSLLARFTNIAGQLQNSFQDDAPLFSDLQQFSRSLLPRAATAFAEKAHEVESVLQTQTPVISATMRQTEQRRFVEGLLELLQKRANLTKNLTDLDSGDNTNLNPTDYWRQTAENLGNGLQEGLGQLAGLATLDSNFIEDLLQGDLKHDWAARLFVLSRSLKVLPYLNLQDDAIDAFFQLGNGQVRIPNIGSPDRQQLGMAWNDPLLTPSYIGASPLQGIHYLSLPMVAKTAHDGINVAAGVGTNLIKHGIRYGNYGGPGWTNGEEGGIVHDDETKNLAPADSMDMLFYAHDKAYQDAEKKDPVDENRLKLKADIALMEKLNKLPENPNDWKEPKPKDIEHAKLYRAGALKLFPGQIESRQQGLSKDVATTKQAMFKTAREVINTAQVVNGAITSAASSTWDTVSYVGGKFLSNFKDDDGSVSWMKVAGYGIGAVGCGIAVAGTAGIAAPACVGLAIAAGADVARTGVDIAHDKGALSDKGKEYWDIGINVAEFAANGAYALKHADKGLNMTRKALTFMGLNPSDINKAIATKRGGSNLHRLYNMLTNGSTFKSIITGKNFQTVWNGLDAYVGITRSSLNIIGMLESWNTTQSDFNNLANSDGSVFHDGSSGVWIPGMEPTNTTNTGIGTLNQTNQPARPTLPNIKVIPLPW